MYCRLITVPTIFIGEVGGCDSGMIPIARKARRQLQQVVTEVRFHAKNAADYRLYKLRLQLERRTDVGPETAVQQRHADRQVVVGVGGLVNRFQRCPVIVQVSRLCGAENTDR